MDAVGRVRPGEPLFPVIPEKKGERSIILADNHAARIFSLRQL